MSNSAKGSTNLTIRSISRSEQDAFALESQQKTARAASEFAAELVPAGDLDRDEHPRPDTTLAQLASLRPAFKLDGGTVTAGKAAGINDGAAMMLVCDESTAVKNGWSPLAVLGGYATTGCDPKLMGMGPIHATRLICEKLGCGPGDFEIVELNEAFAAQALACIRELDLDPTSVNPDGGAISLGHPLGASGARIVVHLAHKIVKEKAKNGLATLCVGGGMGASVALRAAGCRIIL